MLALLSTQSEFVENALFYAHLAHVRSTDHWVFTYLLKKKKRHLVDDVFLSKDV